jgi:hypothetical protein
VEIGDLRLEIGDWRSEIGEKCRPKPIVAFPATNDAKFGIIKKILSCYRF